MLNMNARQMEKMMKQMGIISDSIEADEVVIRTASKELIISNPQVTRVKMGGQETFQVSGEVTERKAGFTDEDVKTVMEQTGASKAEAEKALKEEGDLAAAILRLKK
ncbi:MAG: nascent polypeptide-associated complex protein [Candidatus Aenigmatarchaeota archaeon]